MNTENGKQQRVIKFRYCYTDGQNWIFKVFTLDEIVNGEPFEVLSDQPLLRKYKHVGQDEWTGLHDKKGVEIYEGDIIKHSLCSKYYMGNEWVVTFEFGSFQMRIESEELPVSFVFHAYSALREGKIKSQNEYEQHIEVISNIHTQNHSNDD